MKNDLGILKKPSKTRVVVAMSGGVDSSVVAGMLNDQGYEVIGVTLQLYNSNNQSQKSKTCCAGQDIIDAKRVADTLGIKHYVFDYEKIFKERVIDKFAHSYRNGETPIPCINCNQEVKFQDLLITAKQLGADVMATGHYIRRIEENNKISLYKAKDISRDQSYFLFNTTLDQLKFLRFPLGNYYKEDVRALAAKLGLLVADKPDSQDICFVTDGNYAKMIERVDSNKAIPGDIVDLDDNVIGRHDGIIHFTVGQRRGIKIGNKDPYYVIKIDAKENKIVVGGKESLLVKKINLTDVNWLTTYNRRNLKLDVKLRSTQDAIKANLEENKGNWNVIFNEGESGVSPGQACVFYDGEKLVGGGWITGVI